MAGLMLNGSMIQGLVYNGNPVSAMYNGQLIWPTASPLPTYERAYLIIGWNNGSNEGMNFAGLSANGESAPYTSVCFSGQYFNENSWRTIDASQMDRICNTTASQSEWCSSAKFYFSGTPSSGWKSISFKTDQYYQPVGAITVQVWGSAGNFQRCMGSGTYSMNTNTTYTVNLS